MKGHMTKIKRFTVFWDGHAESPAQVIDTKTQSVVKEFSPYEIGTSNACKAAAKLATELNGTEKRCPECSGEGREQFGPSEQPCEHCNGKGYQTFVNRQDDFQPSDEWSKW